MQMIKRIAVCALLLAVISPQWAAAQVEARIVDIQSRGSFGFGPVAPTPQPGEYGSVITYIIEVTSGATFSPVQMDTTFSSLDVNSFADLTPSMQIVTNQYDPTGTGMNFSPSGTWSCNGSIGMFFCDPDGIGGMSPGDLPMGLHQFTVDIVVTNAMPPAFNTFMADMTLFENGLPVDLISVPTDIQAPAGMGTTLEITNAVSQNPVNPVAGDPLEYSVDVTNTGGFDAAAAWTLDLSSLEADNFSYVSGPFNCLPTTGMINCTFDEIMAGGSLSMGQTVTLVVSADSPPEFVQLGTFVTNATLTAMAMDTVSGMNPVPIVANNDATIITNIIPPTDPTPLGGTMFYDITVMNTNMGAAARGLVVDIIADDNNVTGTAIFQNGTGTNWDCMFGQTRGDGQSRGPSLMEACMYLADLAPGATTPTLTLEITAPTDMTATQYIADITQFAQNYGGSPGDTQTIMTNLAGGANDSDLALDVQEFNIDVDAGNVFPVNIDVSNGGPDDANNVMVDLTFGNDVFFSNSLSPNWNCTGSTNMANCQLTSGPLSNGANDTLTVQFSAGAPFTSDTISAVVSSDSNDSNASNDSDSTDVNINAPLNFLIDVVDSPDPAMANGPVNFNVTVLQGGGGQRSQADSRGVITNVQIDATLPAGATFDGFMDSGGGWACAPSGQTVSCTNPMVIPFSNDIFSLQVTMPNQNGVVTTSFNATAMGEPPFNLDVDTTLTGATGVDLELIKRSSVDSVQTGDEFDFIYTINNVGAAPATGVTLTETLPDGIVFISSNGNQWSCTNAGQDITCNYLSDPLNPAQTTIFTVQLQAPDFEGDISSTAVLSLNEPDVNPNNNVDDSTVMIVERPPVDLSLVKTSIPASVNPGGSFQYQLSLTNNSGNEATLVRIDDMLPVGVIYNGFSGDDFMCVDNGGMVTCSLVENMMPGQNSVVTLDVTAPTMTGLITNTAIAASLEPESSAADNTASADTNIGGQGADLSISKTASSPSVTSNEDLNFTISVLNNGPEDASSVQVTDNLPTGYGLDSISASGWSCSSSGGVVSCTLLQDLASGASSDITLNGFITASSGSVTNTASVSADTADPDTSNNTASASVSVIAGGEQVDLEVTKTDSKDPVLLGETFDYIITVRNLGLASARGVQLIDQLPSAISVSSINAPSDVLCSASGPMLTCDFQSPVLNGNDRVITVSVTAPDQETTLTNSVSVTTTNLDSNLGNNTAIEETTVSETPSEDQFMDALMDNLGGPGSDPLISDNIAPVSTLCSSPPPNLVEFCNSLFTSLNDGDSSEASGALRSILGIQTKTQTTSLVEASSTQFSNVDARMAQNRGNPTGGITFNGLNLRYGNESLPVSFMQTDSDEPQIDSAGLIKPWGFFMNGTISMGDKDSDTNQVGFDFDTYGITGGFDYRFSNRFIMGAALGYADFESDGSDGGSLETDGVTLHLFSSYYPTDRIYIDGRVSFGNLDFEQRRPVSFTLGDLTVNDLARGSTESDQFSIALAAGYNFNRNGWNITPSASVSYMDADIDGFTETGSDFALTFDEQNVESMIFSASLNVTKAISLSKGVLTPQFDFSYHHETMNDDNDINSQIIGAPAGSSFFVDADSPDRNYGSAMIGLVYITSNGKQVYLNYREVLGLSGFSRGTLNAGFRVEF